MAKVSLYMGSDNLVLVEGLHDTQGLMTATEMDGATGQADLYSDAAMTSGVTGATSLTLTAAAGNDTTDGAYFDFYATIPDTVTLTEGTTYYLKATITATDVSASVDAKLTLKESVVARYAQ